VDPAGHVSGRTTPVMCSKTLLLCAGVVGALLWILLGMSVVAPLLWAIVILLLDLTLSTEVMYLSYNAFSKKENGRKDAFNK
jgi:hypothetical protein